MKKIIQLVAVLSLLTIFNHSFAQVTIDKNVNLTGAGDEATLRIGGNIFVKAYVTSTLLGNTQNTAMTATDNVLVGYQAGKSITTGGSNLYIGYQTGSLNTTGKQNTFIGTQAGYNSTGDACTLIGYLAGWTLSTNAYNNIFIGTKAGYSINATDNLFIGNNTSAAMTTGFRNTNIGMFVNRMAAKGTDNVFIGYNTADNTEGSLNVYVGSRAVQLGSLSDSNNVVIGALSGNSMGNNGKKNTLIGSQADFNTSNLQNAAAIGYNSRVAKGNTMMFGNTSVRGWGFGIADIDTTINALVVGSNAYNGNGARLTKGGVWTNTSDKNKKENFVTLNGEEILTKIANLPITQWNYKGENASIKHIGPMAQDFYKTFRLGGDDKSISTIDPAGIALVAIQELYKKEQIIEKQLEEINKLKADLDLLKTSNQTMNQEIAEIKALIKKDSSEASKK